MIHLLINIIYIFIDYLLLEINFSYWNTIGMFKVNPFNFIYIDYYYTVSKLPKALNLTFPWKEHAESILKLAGIVSDVIMTFRS